MHFNLKIYHPPPYERGGHYQKVDVEKIRKAIDQFPWALRFINIDVNEKVNLFNKTIKNIIRNYIPHETITCDDRDPPCINKEIKKLIHEKNKAYMSYSQNKKTYSLFISSNFFNQS